MGHNNSKRLSQITDKNKILNDSLKRKRQLRTWTSFLVKTNDAETTTTTDINNNCLETQIKEKETLHSTLETRVVSPLADIQSTLIPSVRKSTPVPFTIIKKGPRCSRDAFRKDNVFARPLNPEMVCVQYATVSATDFPVTMYKKPVKLHQSEQNIPSTTGDTEVYYLTTPATVPVTGWSTGNQVQKYKTSSGDSTKISDTPKSGAKSDFKNDECSLSKAGRRSERDRGPYKTGCCGVVPPPAYLDYSAPSYKNRYEVGGRRNSTGNPIIDKLKNVDVVEELKYFVPEQNDCEENPNENEEFKYYLLCDCCGEMEPCQKHKENSKKLKSGNPVTYCRRQRFNFVGGNKGADDEDDENEDGPPFVWPQNKLCGCPCCIAGLRRNPKCECKCCQAKGRARVVNSFDEIPVGKNPEPKPIKPCICDKEEEDRIQCEKLLPKKSGVYFYDAEEKRFVRQVPRTPTPLIVDRSQIEETIETNQPICYPDICEFLSCLPTRKPQRKPQLQAPEPIVLPPIYGGCNDMRAVLANIEMTMREGNPCLTNAEESINSSKNLQTSNIAASDSSKNRNNNVGLLIQSPKNITKTNKPSYPKPMIQQVQHQNNYGDEEEDEDEGDDEDDMRNESTNEPQSISESTATASY